MARCAPVLVFLASFSALPARAAAPCPESCTTNEGATVCTLAAARDSSTMESCPYIGDVHATDSGFDLVLGTTRASAYSCRFGSSDWASVVARDRYRVVGPAGGAMAFTAHVYALGNVGSSANVRVTLSETGGGSVHFDEGLYGGSFIQELVLPLTHAPGEEFELVIETYAGSQNGFGQAGTHLSFTGLPAGYGVASCQGFNGGGAVPALRASWGALKVRYR